MGGVGAESVLGLQTKLGRRTFRLLMELSPFLVLYFANISLAVTAAKTDSCLRLPGSTSWWGTDGESVHRRGRRGPPPDLAWSWGAPYSAAVVRCERRLLRVTGSNGAF